MCWKWISQSVEFMKCSIQWNLVTLYNSSRRRYELYWPHCRPIDFRIAVYAVEENTFILHKLCSLMIWQIEFCLPPSTSQVSAPCLEEQNTLGQVSIYPSINLSIRLLMSVSFFGFIYHSVYKILLLQSLDPIYVYHSIHLSISINFYSFKPLSQCALISSVTWKSSVGLKHGPNYSLYVGWITTSLEQANRYLQIIFVQCPLVYYVKTSANDV